MQNKSFKKFMVTGLASVLCAGGMSVASLPSYNSDYVATAYAATIKDTALKATGTVNSNVFLRKGPGTSYSKIVVLKKGAKVDIVAKSSNNWYKVKYGKGFGYVYSKYVTVKSETPTTKKDVAYNATGTVKSNVYVRKTASTSAKKLGVLKKGTKVTIVAKNYTGNWYKVKYNKGFGYVSAKYVTVKAPTPTHQDVAFDATGTIKSNVYVRETASTSAKKLGVLKKGTEVTIVAKTSTEAWYKVKYNDGYGYVSAKYVTVKAPTPSNKDIAFDATGTIKSNVYVRETSNTSAKKLGVLKKGTEVTIVAKTSTEAWYKVKYNDGYGYVSSKYVTLTSEQPEVQYPATAVANHDVYVRNGGSPKAKKLGAITKGTKVTVVEKCQYNWYKIQYKDGFGYVYGEYLDIVLVQK